MKACFFLQFTPCQFFRIFNLHLPAALRQFQRALLDRVAELLDEPNLAVLDRQNDCAVILVYNTVGPFLAVRPQNPVLAQPQPLIAINLATRKGFDRVELITAGRLQSASPDLEHLPWMHFSSRNLYFRSRPTSDAGPLTDSRTRFPSYFLWYTSIPASIAASAAPSLCGISSSASIIGSEWSTLSIAASSASNPSPVCAESATALSPFGLDLVRAKSPSRSCASSRSILFSTSTRGLFNASSSPRTFSTCTLC